MLLYNIFLVTTIFALNKFGSQLHHRLEFHSTSEPFLFVESIH